MKLPIILFLSLFMSVSIGHSEQPISSTLACEMYSTGLDPDSNSMGDTHLFKYGIGAVDFLIFPTSKIIQVTINGLKYLDNRHMKVFYHDEIMAMTGESEIDANDISKIGDSEYTFHLSYWISNMQSGEKKEIVGRYKTNKDGSHDFSFYSDFISSGKIMTHEKIQSLKSKWAKDVASQTPEIYFGEK